MASLPPGWPAAIAGLPILFVFVGAPDSFAHARRERDLGFTNHVAVRDIAQALTFNWPTLGLSVIVILFASYEKKEEAELVALLLADDPIDVIVRYWPDTSVVRRTP